MIYHPILDATVIDCNPGHVKILIEIALEGRDMWMAGREMLCRQGVEGAGFSLTTLCIYLGSTCVKAERKKAAQYHKSQCILILAGN